MPPCSSRARFHACVWENPPRKRAGPGRIPVSKGVESRAEHHKLAHPLRHRGRQMLLGKPAARGHKGAQTTCPGILVLRFGAGAHLRGGLIAQDAQRQRIVEDHWIVVERMCGSPHGDTLPRWHCGVLQSRDWPAPIKTRLM